MKKPFDFQINETQKVCVNAIIKKNLLREIVVDKQIYV